MGGLRRRSELLRRRRWWREMPFVELDSDVDGPEYDAEARWWEDPLEPVDEMRRALALEAAVPDISDSLSFLLTL